MGEAHFRTPPLRIPSTNFDVMSNILLRPPRELMCKIWLESIWPLRICACVKKHVMCGFFKLTYLSVRFFVGATGHSFVAILTLSGSNDVISQPLVPAKSIPQRGCSQLFFIVGKRYWYVCWFYMHFLMRMNHNNNSGVAIWKSCTKAIAHEGETQLTNYLVHIGVKKCSSGGSSFCRFC